MTDLQFQILDECYFVSSYQNILDNIDCDESAFKESLANLLGNQLIAQLKFDSSTKDYDRLSIPDLNSLENSFFVATKEGLLRHNSRG
jgi:hypothetical protein